MKKQFEVCLKHFIGPQKTIPKNTVVVAGEDISPGEKQLIGVARAVLRQSRIVALDEVTSRVDQQTDLKVQSALKRLPEGAAEMEREWFE